jgi:hypothetical protein
MGCFGGRRPGFRHRRDQYQRCIVPLTLLMIATTYDNHLASQELVSYCRHHHDLAVVSQLLFIIIWSD